MKLHRKTTGAGSPRAGRARFFNLIAGALLGLSMPPASAADLRTLQQAAGAVEAYEQSKDTCYYAPGVGEIVQRVNVHFERQNGFIWRGLREEAAPMIGMGVNMDRIIEQGREPAKADAQRLCDVVAINVGYLLAIGLMIVGPTAPGIEDLDCLSGGHGRVK
ncbi:hypothetical protein [Ancylobacter vacuolatus]|uniref:Uncharacterized protein n=1 Tax=Ancylobacter vacuolatus TaxID=223389 RepID=A0ABU0DPH2_9HYPH|nr:hypothetical protein [Ancylobacter vacuolatus]MDQ0350188.1 hypothetical protein [Ancylobacter vacuolatus]